MKKEICRITALLLAVITLLAPVSASAAFVTIGGVNKAQAVDDEEAVFTFNLISDTHIGAADAEDVMIEGFQKMQAEQGKADAVVICGDLTNTGDPAAIEHFFSVMSANRPNANVITATGNHDMGQTSPSAERRATFIKCRNADMGISTATVYYSYEVKGIKFIVLGDEGNGINTCKITDTQIQWLDNELKTGAVDGKPVFVICHWPMRRCHGAHFLWPIWPGGNLNFATTNKLMNVMTKYDNVFYLSGHLHEGINGIKTTLLFNACCVEDHKGVTCINSPSFGKTNRFGIGYRATGFEIAVYDSKVTILGRNFLTGEYFSDAKYTFSVPLKKAAEPEAIPMLMPAA